MTVKATLGGVALLGDGAVTWRQTHGVFPVVQEFSMEPSRAKNLVSGPGIPIDLVVSDDGKTHVWADLLAVGHSPATNPHMMRVKVVDKRWYWKFKIVVMRFNMRRRIGTVRRETLDTDKQQPNVVPRLQYAPYSLKPGTVAAKANKKGQGDKGAKKAKPLPSRVWTAPEVIQTIIEKASPVGTRIILDPSLDTLKALPIENLVIDDEGPAAVQRALS